MGSVPVITDRTFRFVGDRDLVWDALTRTDRYRTWWPWLAEFDAGGLHTGAVWRCGVRSPLRTMLRFRLHIDAAADFAVDSRLDGDLEGTARLSLRPSGDHTSLRLEARVRPTVSPVAALTRLVPTLAQWSHDRIIDSGARQFADALARETASACDTARA